MKHRPISPTAPTTDHLVIDIETLGRRPGCEIRSIGAALVSWGTDLMPPYYTGHAMVYGRSFYRLTTDSTLYQGYHDQPTIDFWASKKVSPRARRHMFTTANRIPIDTALAHLSVHIAALRRPGRDLLIWANGPQFDISILEYAYRETAQPIPWQYWEVRDIRTALSLHPCALRRRTTKHHAQLDAEHDAKRLAMILNRLASPSVSSVKSVSKPPAKPIVPSAGRQESRPSTLPAPSSPL